MSHGLFDHLNDEALLEAAREMRQRSHDAPKCIAGAAGGEHISGDAFARWSAEWARMEAELDRRGVRR